MLGMDRNTGQVLAGDAHLAQSLTDIITTPLGTRIMRRDYGSLLFELLDRPLNAVTRLLITMACTMAIDRWEPRIKITGVQFIPNNDGADSANFSSGSAHLTITGHRTDDPDPNALTRLSIPIT